MQDFLRTCCLSIAIAGAVAAQSSATFAEFGTACVADRSHRVDLLRGNGDTDLPRLGQSMEFIYVGPNQVAGTGTYRPHFTLGFTPFPGLTIPSTLLPEQPPGCMLAMAHDFVAAMQADPNGRNTFMNSFVLPIPNDRALLGGQFFVQWLTLSVQCGIVPPCTPNWIITTEAGHAVVGV